MYFEILTVAYLFMKFPTVPYRQKQTSVPYATEYILLCNFIKA